jgi:ribosomal protein S18 acetylase RimI-like enzyme
MVESLAPWVVAASRPFADWYFGAPELADEVLREWMVRRDSEVFVGRAVVEVDADDRPRGCIIAMTGADLRMCRAADFGVFCDEIGAEPGADAVIEEIVSASEELFLPVPDDVIYVSRVGVDPASAGKGIGRALVIEVLEFGRRAGLRGCRLDVSADNLAAIRAYRAASLEVVETRHSATAGLSYCAMQTMF